MAGYVHSGQHLKERNEMSRGPGKIERAVFELIAEQTKRNEQKDESFAAAGQELSPRPVCIFPGMVAHKAFKTDARFLTRSQRVSATRAMHSFARKFPRYGLLSSKNGRLALYDREDKVSAMWAKLQIKGGWQPIGSALAALNHLEERRNEPFSRFNRERVSAPVIMEGGAFDGAILLNPPRGHPGKKQRRRNKVFSDISLPA
jgi:hypothetical protein